MTTAKAAEPADPLAKLREPFLPHQISKKPQPYKRDSPKGNCQECGGYHGLPAMHLEYVGHAALTDRLLDTDLRWTWEPMSKNPDGSPRLIDGGLWINLTVCGVTRPGYGDADGKTGGNAVKEAIGDALRNASMRFGAALDLWHKGDLHKERGVEGQEDEPRQDRQREQTSRQEPADFTASLDGAKAAIDLLSTDDGLRKWVDEQAAFLKELPEGPHNELVAYWKARMAKVREPATSDFAAMDYNDQLKTAAGHIAICKTRVDLDKWAAHYQDWTDKIPDDDYNMLNKAWKERHAALAPQQREGFN